MHIYSLRDELRIVLQKLTRCEAPVVKRISRIASDDVFRVQILAGAQKIIRVFVDLIKPCSKKC